MRSVELFAGAGGLGMGVARAGFQHDAVIEWNKHACASLRFNQDKGLGEMQGWPIIEGDVTSFDYGKIIPNIDLLAGGPPCQPFSLGGKHQAYLDPRDMFPQYFRAVRELQPKAFIVENVKGLLRDTFATYLQYILLQLTYPEVEHMEGEDWDHHLIRLEEHHTQGNGGLTYKVSLNLVNAANYGVPQRRERVFIIGIRSDIDVAWSFPEPTHSQEKLLYDMFVSGDYWERHQVARRNRLLPTQSQLRRAHKASSKGLFTPTTEAWQTVRDAISDLPEPTVDDTRIGHVLVPGARSYPGHTGSPPDAPAKTLKAGVHGVPGGENTLTLSDGSVRYFTVKEALRLQTFPDDYRFPGAWTEAMRQIGNAVPVRLAELIAHSLAQTVI